jgi:hypothetical protein
MPFSKLLLLLAGLLLSRKLVLKIEDYLDSEKKLG